MMGESFFGLLVDSEVGYSVVVYCWLAARLFDYFIL
jgi:hypothetical protein